MMKTTTTTVWALSLALACFALANVHGAYYEALSTQCRQSLVDAPGVVGNFETGTEIGFPQRCALLFPFRNIYNEKEKEVGEFQARSCGECASVCVATRYGPGFGLADEITDSMSSEEAAKVNAIVEEGSYVCDSWVWCDPLQAVSYEYCEETVDPSSMGADPFSPSTCIGPYTGYGPDTYLQGSVQGCRTISGKVIPAGTCTLKQIESDKYDDYLWGNATYVENEANPTPWMSAMCDWSFDKYAGDQPYVESYYN